jgi:hypothetical protein
MKLARQQGEVSEGKWGAASRRPRQADRRGERPGLVQPEAIQTASREDDPYRGKSDGEILQRCEL